MRLKQGWITIFENRRAITGLYVEKNADQAIGLKYSFPFAIVAGGLPIFSQFPMCE